MTEKTWGQLWQERITNLLSRRFVGFGIACTYGWLKPETLTFMITLYGILIGGKIAQEAVRGRNGKHA